MFFPPLLPPLEDDSSQDNHDHIEHVQGDEAHGIVDGHVVVPQQRERPEHGEDVEDDVTQERPLGQGERLGDGDRTHHHRGNKYTGSWQWIGWAQNRNIQIKTWGEIEFCGYRTNELILYLLYIGT